MKYFVVADVHGFFDELKSVLKQAGYDKSNKEHIFVSLGDLLDRGTQAKECLNFVNSIPEENKILIRGNHEDLLEDIFERMYFKTHDLHNGTVDTFNQITNCKVFSSPDDVVINEVKNYKPLKRYLNSLVNYKEIGDNIFVHGWIPCFDKWGSSGEYNPDWRNSTYEQWKSARWLNGMAMWDKGIVEPGKTIWCGHWHTSWGHSRIEQDGVEFLDRIETYYTDIKKGKQEPHANYKPFIAEGIVAMDACTAVSGFINCKIIEG